MAYKDPAVGRAKTAERLRKLRQQPGYSTRKNADWQIKHPEKRSAHKAVENALLRGDLAKCPCERCGAEQAHAHHDDYSKPLQVMWLCRSHHAERHRELKHASQLASTAAASDCIPSIDPRIEAMISELEARGFFVASMKATMLRTSATISTASNSTSSVGA